MASRTKFRTLEGNPPHDAAGQYAAELHRRMTAILLARHRDPEVAHDVASHETVAFLQRSAAIMQRYPSPASYAAARAAHGRSDHLRRERVQRSEGARLVVGPNETIRSGRQALSGDRVDPETGSTLWETHIERDPISPYNAVDEHSACQQLTNVLTEVQHHIVERVVLGGETVRAVAADLGIARETAQRKLRQALDVMRAVAEAWQDAA